MSEKLYHSYGKRRNEEQAKKKKGWCGFFNSDKRKEIRGKRTMGYFIHNKEDF